MRFPKRLVGGWVVVALLLTTTGCRYATNRYYDFRDTVAMGAGITAENSITGVVPPSLGLYVELTDLLHLGWITHNGYTAETDLRGSFVGPESTMRAGFLWWQMLRKYQDYDNATYMNAFKDREFPWNLRMASLNMTKYGEPAKRLYYQDWGNRTIEGTWMLHRGWQYWEYSGVELALCDPFLTHLGVMLRLGIDISEISDFVLGWTGIDFKHDDMNEHEYAMFRHGRDGFTVDELPPGMAEDEAGASRESYDELQRRNRELEEELERLRGRLAQLDNGIEFEIPEHVLFDTGKAQLRSEGKALLGRIAERIQREYSGYRIEIEGHTDSRPVVVHRHLWKTNWELGAGRALAVTHYLIDEAGLPKDMFKASTYADNKPVAPNTTPENMQRNRRAVIVLRAVEPVAAEVQPSESEMGAIPPVEPMQESPAVPAQ